MNSAIEAACRQVVLDHVPPSRLREAMLYSLQAGGKRLRPYLYLLHKKVFTDLIEADYRFAACLELIHTYSLIHDDLPAMDDDTMRRGKPTNHVVYGEAMAILAGDALLNTALQELMLISIKEPAYLQAAYDVAEASGASGMIYGQALDMQSEHQTLSLDAQREIADHKTGALIRVAINSACKIAQIDRRDSLLFEQLSTILGFAFQVRDDILDVESDEETMGKSIGKDAEHAKATTVSVLGLDNAKTLYEELRKSVFDDLAEVATVDTELIRDYYTRLFDRTH